MTNKPMLSVEREQILAVCNVVAVAEKLEKEAFAKGVSHVDVAAFRSLRYALDHLTSVSAVELRALLDNQADCRCKRYGKDNPHWPCPVHAEPAAQHQGEPVAWIKKEVASTLTGDECCYAFGRQSPAGNLIPLYAEQPAPVAVVMPENLESHRRSWIAALDRLIALETDADDLLFWQHEYSALRDMYADLDRLNGVKP